MPFSDDYVRSKFTHKDERGVFRLSDLNPPGGRGPVYEFYETLFSPWRYTEEKMERNWIVRGAYRCARSGR